MIDSKAYSLTNIDGILSWARYLYWADIFAKRFNVYIEKSHDFDNDEVGWEFFALMSHWYASLWVVIEGWQKLGLQDKAIEKLLNSRLDYCALLKRYRNGVYHFQPRIIDERFGAFLRESNNNVPWIHNLHGEFLRFFREWVDQFEGTKLEKADFRKSLLAAVGWLPSDAGSVYILQLEKAIAEAESLLESDDGSNSYSASLKEAISKTKQILQNLRDSKEIMYRIKA